MEEGKGVEDANIVSKGAVGSTMAGVLESFNDGRGVNVIRGSLAWKAQCVWLPSCTGCSSYAQYLQVENHRILYHIYVYI